MMNCETHGAFVASAGVCPICVRDSTDRAERDYDELKRQLAASENARGEIGQLKQLIAEKNVRIDEAERRLAEARAELEGRDTTIDQLDAELDTCREALREAEANTDLLKRNISKILLSVVGGNEDYRYEGYIRWGAVEKAINDAIDTAVNANAAPAPEVEPVKPSVFDDDQASDIKGGSW